MSIAESLQTESKTDLLSFGALLGVVVSISLYTDILGASGGDLAFMPGTGLETALEPYILPLLVIGLLVGYFYNGQSLDDLEAADAVVGVLGVAAPLVWFYVPQVQSSVPAEYEVWARMIAGLAGIIGAYIFSFGNEGGILG